MRTYFYRLVIGACYFCRSVHEGLRVRALSAMHDVHLLTWGEHSQPYIHVETTWLQFCLSMCVHQPSSCVQAEWNIPHTSNEETICQSLWTIRAWSKAIPARSELTNDASGSCTTKEDKIDEHVKEALSSEDLDMIMDVWVEWRLKNWHILGEMCQVYLRMLGCARVMPQRGVFHGQDNFSVGSHQSSV